MGGKTFKVFEENIENIWEVEIQKMHNTKGNEQ